MANDPESTNGASPSTLVELQHIVNNNPEAAALQAREGQRQLTRRATQTGIGVLKYDTSVARGDHMGAVAAAQEIRGVANERRSKEQMLAAMDDVFQTDTSGISQRIASLPSFDGVTFIRRDAHAQFQIEGKIYTESGGDERERMRTIQSRLKRTAGKNKNFFSKKQSYLAEYAGTYELDRSLLEQDIRWISDGKRVGVNVPEKRRALFTAYRSVLTDLVMQNTPKAEAAFTRQSKSLVGQRACLETYCRDPNAIKGASKFAALLAVGALLALWGIKDARNKSLSLGTLVLLGGVMFLMQSGSKHNYLSSQQFTNLTKGPIDGNAIKKLQSLSRSKPSAYNHLTSWLDKQTRYNGGRIESQYLHQITKPINGRGKPDPRKAVPEDIAKLLVGLNSSDAAYVLKSLKATARTSDRKIAVEFADASHNSKGGVQRELQNARLNPAFNETIEPKSRAHYGI